MSKRLWWALVVLGSLAFLYRVRTVLTPFLFAVLIAYLLYPLVVAVEKRGASRIVAILVIYALFSFLIGMIFWLILPGFLGDLEDIVKKLPEQAWQLESMGQDALSFFREIQLPGTLRDGFAIILERIQIALETLASRLMQVFMTTFTHILSLVISPVLAFYFLRDHQAMREGFLRYIPAKRRGDVLYILKEINSALNGFFRGQILVCLFVGVFIYLGLYFLKIPYALFIGFLAGLFDIIPYFGPVLGFLPAAALGLAKSPITVVWVLALFIAANQIENAVISPKLIGDRVGLHPLVVIFSVFVGADLMGIIGMLLAIPVAAIIKVLLVFFFLRRS